jgi:tRNA-dihydrouridine synthase B
MRIGHLEIAQPFCQAGLAGYSDRAMRLVARRRGCPYAVTEALLDTILLNGGEGLRKSIDVNDEDHPVAGQIMGSEPAQMARAAVIIRQAGYDVVDLNFACPVKKIKNKARGGHMLRDVARGVAILRAVRDVTPAGTPLTVSLRRAFDETTENEDALFTLADEMWQLGYAALRVHARTVEQRYLGRSDRPFLKKVKDAYPTRTILGSGDVFTAQDVVDMLAATGVDGVWIARGAIGNPWIFTHAARLLENRGSKVEDRGSQEDDASLRDPRSSILDPRPLLPPTIHEQRDALAEHFREAMALHGEQLSGRRMRKQGIKYSRFHPNATEVKTAFVDTSSLRDWQAVLDRWYSSDGPGVWPAADAPDEVNESAATTSAAPVALQSCEVD